MYKHFPSARTSFFVSTPELALLHATNNNQLTRIPSQEIPLKEIALTGTALVDISNVAYTTFVETTTDILGKNKTLLNILKNKTGTHSFDPRLPQPRVSLRNTRLIITNNNKSRTLSGLFARTALFD